MVMMVKFTETGFAGWAKQSDRRSVLIFIILALWAALFGHIAQATADDLVGDLPAPPDATVFVGIEQGQARRVIASVKATAERDDMLCEGDSIRSSPAMYCKEGGSGADNSVITASINRRGSIVVVNAYLNVTSAEAHNQSQKKLDRWTMDFVNDLKSRDGSYKVRRCKISHPFLDGENRMCKGTRLL